MEGWNQQNASKKGRTDHTRGKGKGTKTPAPEPQPERVRNPAAEFYADQPRSGPQLSDTKTQEKALAKQLIKVLKQCMNTGLGETDVIASIMSEITKHQKVSDDKLDWEKGAKNKGKGGKKELQVTGDEKQTTQRQTGDKPRAAFPISELKESEWTFPPRLSQFGKWQHLLREGKGDQVNLVEVTSQAQFLECKTLCTSFDLKHGFTIMLTGTDAGMTKDLTQTRVTATRNRRVAIEAVRLCKLSTMQNGPWIAPPTKVNPDCLPQNTKVLVRIAAPYKYRKFHIQKNDDPASIISTLATQSGCPVAPLTGGKWTKQTVERNDHGDQLVGYVRLQESEAKTIIQVSGACGIFSSLQQKCDVKPDLFWIKRNENETDENYARRCLGLSKERKQPCILRNGGGNDIGFSKKTSDQPDVEFRVVDAMGFNHKWDEQDVKTLVEAVGWKDVNILSRKKIFGSFSWRLRGIPPPETKKQTSWSYEIPENSFDGRGDWTLNVLCAPLESDQLRSSLFEAQNVNFEVTLNLPLKLLLFPQKEKEKLNKTNQTTGTAVGVPKRTMVAKFLPPEVPKVPKNKIRWTLPRKRSHQRLSIANLLRRPTLAMEPRRT